MVSSCFLSRTSNFLLFAFFNWIGFDTSCLLLGEVSDSLETSRRGVRPWKISREVSEIVPTFYVPIFIFTKKIQNLQLQSLLLKR